MKTKQSKGKTPGEMLESKLEKLLFVDNLSTDPPQDTQEAGWEKELDGLWADLEVTKYPKDALEDIKNYIRETLRSEQKRWEGELRKRIEGMMRVDPTYRDDTENNIHNKALSDVLSLLSEGDGKGGK